MKRSTIAEILKSGKLLQDITLKGWVRTFRANRFIALNDGSTINNIQLLTKYSG